ncbi:cation diffusion facilitator family transporter [Spirulina sp. CS-785/01]|nr:cation diffusion facilitator family transporter [Spirulina sp. CS-785/01]MDB9311469.1 cation diffusion facilitator family transporter [Spirulina sp. CS-785/01]
MSHSHHHHAPTSYNRAFLIGTILNVVFVVIEAGYGFFTNSLALLADAGHNLSDVLGLILAWGASALSQFPPSGRYTYGLRRSSILAALLNGIILLLAMGAIAWESIQRFYTPHEVAGQTIIIVALIGVREIEEELHDHFGIAHATIQVENGDPNYPCHLAPDHHV